MPWDFWLIFFVLGVVIPWRGRVRLQRLLAQPAIGTKEKLILYGTTAAFQWILFGIVAWRAVARGFTAAQLGFGRRLTVELLFLSVAGAALLGAFQWFNLRRVGGMTGTVPDFMRKLAERILPSETVEFVPYCALAVTAGICEEFLYRGFAMAALSRAGIVPWAAVVITSLLFGLAHTYQGKSGIVGTMLMGLLFGTSRMVFRSLLPVMVWHSTVDIAAGVAGPKYLVHREETK
ncbi:MAG: type II CAAX endopeptidase family protein [Candidatus Acidiferrum sp.]